MSPRSAHSRVLPEMGSRSCQGPVHRWLDSYAIVFPVLLFVGLYAFGGMSWLIWAGFVRTVFVLHTTWLVNSATHVWGYRTYQTRDDSTNLWWVALLTYGEGWHNNHHAFQTSSRHGFRWWEVDMTYLAIRALSAVGLAQSLKIHKLTPARGGGRSRPRRSLWPSRSPTFAGVDLCGGEKEIHASPDESLTTGNLASDRGGRAFIEKAPSPALAAECREGAGCVAEIPGSVGPSASETWNTPLSPRKTRCARQS